MINIGPTTRKNNVGSLWQIIGDIWNKVKLNDYSRKYVEGMWIGNSILADERLNILLNNYDRLIQRYYQAYKGVMRLDNFSTKIIKRQRLDGFNIEYKYFFSELEDNVKYIYPPKFLTNDFRSPNLIEELFTGVIHRVYPKQNKIILLENSLSDELEESLKGCFFLDFKNNPFIVTQINKNELFYKRVFKEYDPVEGEMKIVRKFELENNVDYKTEIEEDFIIFRFKDFKYIDQNSDIVNFFEQSDIHLYGFDIPYIDNYCEVNFGYPVGLIDEDFKILRKSGLTWSEINQMILDIWKIDQRVYGFDQIYRYAALFSGNDISRGLGEPLYLYSTNIEKEFVLLSKSKNIIDSDIIMGSMIPEYIRTNNNITILDKNNFLKIKSFVLNEISINEPIIIDKETYYVKKNIDNTYIELDREVVNHPISNIVNVLDKSKLKMYNFDNYGKYELNNYIELPNGEMSNLSDILDVSNTVPWGEFPWGSFNFGEFYYQQIHPQCRFKPLEMGKEYLFGDCFQPYVLPNFYYAYDPDTADTESQKYLTGTQSAVPIILKDANKIVPNYYIQKQLALDNKEFTENNFKEYSLNKTLLLLPFFNYSEKLNIAENDLFSRSDWFTDGVVDSNFIYNTFSGYTNVQTEAISDDEFSSIFRGITPFTNNKTGKSLLRLFLRINKGKIRIGISGDIFLENSNTKFIFREKNKKNEDLVKWERIDIFIDNTLLTEGSRYNIVLESYGLADYDIFGVQFYKNIPDYFEKLFKNRKVLEKFVSSNNYKLINLI
jgi:hypothetical protein